VAGTNGKGSTVAFMRAVLEAAGRRVHVYTSPHLVRFHERIRLAGRLVDEARLTAALQECERVNAGAPITLFEMTTAVAFKLFSETPADVLLLEVGLGGRFDATNVVPNPSLCVITPVSIDHAEFLGSTLAAIAFEKAGIIKPRIPVVVAAQEDEACAVIERQAEKLRAPILIGAQDFTGREEHGRLVYQDEAGLLDLPLPRLAGRHQIQNAATAIAALRQFDPSLPEAAFEAGMERVDWPARLQRLPPGPLADLAPSGAEVWLEGGHNVAGGRVLGEAMADLEARAPRPLLLTPRADVAAELRPALAAISDEAEAERPCRGVAEAGGDGGPAAAPEVLAVARDELGADGDGPARHARVQRRHLIRAHTRS
jgi:dihydrofolate synthase/folylpolyglutamate synthase